jgi:hypothetical protein
MSDQHYDVIGDVHGHVASQSNLYRRLLGPMTEIAAANHFGIVDR